MPIRPALFAVSLATGIAAGASHASAAPAAGTCKVVKDGLSLVPDGALAIGHIDGKKAFRSRLYKDLRGALERDLELRDSINIGEKCDVKLADIDQLTVGVGKNDAVVAVVKAQGIGKPKKLACLRNQLAAREGGKVPWTSRRESCYRVLSKDKHDFGFVLDDSTIVFTGEKWSDEVRALINGKGSTAKNGNLSNIVRRVNQTKGAWFAGALDDQSRTQLSGSSFAGIREVGGAIDFDHGLDFNTLLQTADPGAADSLRGELVMYRDLMKSAGMIPGHLLDRMQVGSSGADVNIDVSLSFQELDEVRRALEPHTSGKNPL